MDREWHTLPAPEALAALEASPEGLSESEASRRLALHGPNEIHEERVEPWWSIARHQLRDPLIYILLIAGAVTLAIRDFADAIVILAVVLLNALIGFTQEMRAREAMRALARLSAPRAEVLREGEARTIPSRELVPGDLVLLTSGVRVPADLRLLRATGLEVDESALTGESVPTRKDPEWIGSGRPVVGDQRNLAFAGTIVTRGRARGVVARTGLRTEVGRIAQSMQEIGITPTPLQDKVRAFGGRIGVILLGLGGAAIAIGILRGLPLREVFLTAVAMAVSAIPEGLPVVLTVTLAVGVRRMAGRKAIIRRLPAVEALGSTTVIASDKTGTLTRNAMTVRAIWTAGELFRVSGEGYGLEGEVTRAEGTEGTTGVPVPDPLQIPSLRETLLAAVLANEADARITDAEGAPLGDPTEVALLVAAAKAGLDAVATRAQFGALDLLPFEPEARFMASLNERDGGSRIHLKGAPEAILDRCAGAIGPDGPEPLDRDRILDAAHRMAGEGLRVLGVAVRDFEGRSLTAESTGEGALFAGLVGMEDPVRPEAIEAVAAVRRAGVRVLMLTGDHLATARAVGEKLGLVHPGTSGVEGKELETLSDEALDQRLAAGEAIYARVAPEHKLRIVQRLRAVGEIVAVTGDGVNDAPALRAAHLGVAMGITGTDVAREASDMVLADDNFATIRAAVEEGRVVFSNVRKVTFFLLSTGVGEVFTILAALIFGWPLPFVAVQILWINLVTNGVQDLALAMEPGEPGLMDRPPKSSREGILGARLLERLGGVGVVLAVGTLFTFWWTLDQTDDLDLARTMAMTQMVVFQFFHVFNCRSLDRSIFRIPLFSNPYLFLSFVGASIAQLLALYWAPLASLLRTVPISPLDWLHLFAVGTLVIIGGELDKAWNRRRTQPLG